jgi:hypothetical protein
MSSRGVPQQTRRLPITSQAQGGDGVLDESETGGVTRANEECQVAGTDDGSVGSRTRRQLAEVAGLGLFIKRFVSRTTLFGFASRFLCERFAVAHERRSSYFH